MTTIFSPVTQKQALNLHHYRFKAMGSLCQLWFYGQDEETLQPIFSCCEREAKRFERTYSRYLSESILSQVNKGHRVQVTPEFSSLLKYADVAYEQSDGLFDVTSGLLRQAWDFKSNQLPKASLVSSLLEKIGWQRVVEWNKEENSIQDSINHPGLNSEGLNNESLVYDNHWLGSHFSIPPGMEIDLGGIVKEYAADALGQLAQHQGVAHGLVDLAGDIYVIGPHLKKNPWLIKIQHPRQKQAIIGKINLIQGAIASSGDYERFMIVNNKRYCHVLNPKTGWPAQGVSSVSVAAPHCVIAGTMSTTAMLLGPKLGKEYLTDNGVEHIFRLSV